MYNIPHFVSQPQQVAQLQAALDSGNSQLLSSVKIKLTSLCNLRCQMCAYWKNKSEQALTTDQWFDVLAQLSDMGCRKVHFSGGEVFLRRDFLDLVEHGTALKLKINMTTNGTLFSHERLRRLIKARPNSISLSLDGPKAEIHDKIRGLPGSFKRTTRTIRKLNQLGERLGHRPKIRVNSVLQRSNYKMVPQLVNLVSALGAVELHPMPVDEKGERKNRLSLTQLQAYNRDIAPLVLEERQKAGFSTAPWMVYPFGRSAEELENSRKGNYSLGLYSHKPCLSPWMHLFIGWDGETYLCCMTNRRMDSLGNVSRQSLESIFNGPAMRAVRQRFLQLQMEKACKHCDMVNYENNLLYQALDSLSSH